MKRVVSLITLTCFLMSFVFSETLHAALDVKPGPKKPTLSIEDCIVPQSAGRITDFNIVQGAGCGVRGENLKPGTMHLAPRTVVINILDLHCHPEVQRNISKILSALDEKYGLKKVYVEGGYGNVDTSWLCGIKNGELKKEIIENLVDEGRLTGSEYYSVTAYRPDLLRGIEDESVHKANLVRLGKIIEKKNYFENKIKALNKDLEFMKAKYFGFRNRRFNDLVEKHKAGGIDSAKYYRVLAEYAQKINDDPDKYSNVFSINMDDYPNLNTFLELNKISKQLKYKIISRQMQEFVQLIKSKLPYSVYTSLLQKTDNFTKTDELYVCLASIVRSWELEAGSNGFNFEPRASSAELEKFSELRKFLTYTEKSRNINPIKLIEEEKRLVEEIRIGFSKDVSELEISFLADFYSYFQDFLLNRLSAQDYEYFNQRFDKFKLLWGKYAFKNRISELDNEIQLLEAYYKANCKRNECFLSNIEILKDEGRRMKDEKNSASFVSRPSSFGSIQNPEISNMLNSASDIIVIVTGGFHTEGLKALLKERNITYLSITPNVTQDTRFSSEIYTKIAKEQLKLLEAGSSKLGVTTLTSSIERRASSCLLQLGLFVQSSLFTKYSIALKAVKTNEIPQLLKEMEEKTGVKVISNKDGIIVFDNGAKIKLEEKEGYIEVTKLKEGNISGTVKRSIEEAINRITSLQKLAEAFGKAMLGQPDDFINIVASFAAEHYLLTGNGLIEEIKNNPALNKQEIINGIKTELLARFPDELQKSNAERELAIDNLLDSISQRPDWLQALLAIDLLRGFIGNLISNYPTVFSEAEVKPQARQNLSGLDARFTLDAVVFFPYISVNEDDDYASLASSLENKDIPEIAQVYSQASTVLKSIDASLTGEKDFKHKLSMGRAMIAAHSLAFLVYAKKYAAENKISINYKAYTGNSIGFLFAAIASKAVSITDGVKLIYKFYSITAEHKRKEKFLVLGLSGPDIESVIKAVTSSYPDIEVCWYYSSNQSNVYVPGSKIDEFSSYIRDNFPKISIKELKAPTFYTLHAKSMSDARSAYAEFMDKENMQFNDPEVPLISNNNTGIITKAADVKQSILAIMSEPVYSRQTAVLTAKIKPDLIIEPGFGGRTRQLMVDNDIADIPFAEYTADKSSKKKLSKMLQHFVSDKNQKLAKSGIRKEEIVNREKAVLQNVGLQDLTPGLLTPGLLEYRIPPINFSLPVEKFGEVGKINLMDILMGVCEETLQYKPILSIFGSSAYLIKTGNNLTPDWGMIGDLDMGVIVRDKLDYEVEEKIKRSFFERLKIFENLNVYSRYNLSLGEHQYFIKDNYGKEYEISLYFSREADLFPKSFSPYREDPGAFISSGKVYYGDVNRLNTILNKAGIHSIINNIYKVYIAALYYEKASYNAYKDENTQILRSTKNKLKLLKRLYRIALLRGIENKYDYLLQTYSKLSQEFNPEEYKRVCETTLNSLDGVSAAEIKNEIWIGLEKTILGSQRAGALGFGVRGAVEEAVGGFVELANLSGQIARDLVEVLGNKRVELAESVEQWKDDRAHGMRDVLNQANELLKDSAKLGSYGISNQSGVNRIKIIPCESKNGLIRIVDDVYGPVGYELDGNTLNVYVAENYDLSINDVLHELGEVDARAKNNGKFNAFMAKTHSKVPDDYAQMSASGFMQYYHEFIAKETKEYEKISQDKRTSEQSRYTYESDLLKNLHSKRTIITETIISELEKTGPSFTSQLIPVLVKKINKELVKQVKPDTGFVEILERIRRNAELLGRDRVVAREIEYDIVKLHAALPDDFITRINNEISKIRLQRNYKLVNLYSLLKPLTALSFLNNAKRLNMSADVHVEGVVRAMDKLTDEDYEWLNDRRLGKEDFSRESWDALVKVDRDFLDNPDMRIVRALSAVLHDYGKVIGFPLHQEAGIRVVKNLLDRLDISQDIKNKVLAVILMHDVLFGLGSGERSFKSAKEIFFRYNMDLRTGLLLNLPLAIADATAFFEDKGALYAGQLDVYFKIINNCERYSSLSQEYEAIEMIARKLYSFDSFHKNKNKNRAEIMAEFPGEIKDDIIEISKMRAGVKESFEKFLLESKMPYSFYFLTQRKSRINEQHFIKMLFLLSEISRVMDVKVRYCSFANDHQIEVLTNYIDSIGSISDIHNTVQAMAAGVMKEKNGKQLKLAEGITADYIDSTRELLLSITIENKDTDDDNKRMAEMLDVMKYFKPCITPIVITNKRALSDKITETLKLASEEGYKAVEIYYDDGVNKITDSERQLIGEIVKGSMLDLIIHAPWSAFVNGEGTVRDPDPRFDSEKFEDCIKLASDTRVKIIDIHMGNPESREHLNDIVDFVKRAAKNKITISVENALYNRHMKEYTDVKDYINDMVYPSGVQFVEGLEYIYSRLSDEEKRYFGVTFDVAHASIGNNLFEFYESIKKQGIPVRNVHLNQHNGVVDNHQPIYREGAVPMMDMLKTLADDGYDGYVTLEVRANNMSMKDVQFLHKERGSKVNKIVKTDNMSGNTVFNEDSSLTTKHTRETWLGRLRSGNEQWAKWRERYRKWFDKIGGDKRFVEKYGIGSTNMQTEQNLLRPFPDIVALLFQTLGLNKINEIPGVKVLNKFKYLDKQVVQIYVPPVEILGRLPAGFEIVQKEMNNIENFDLIYDEDGRLLFVFPSRGEIEKRGVFVEPKYINLTYYYFNIPQVGDNGAEDKWKSYYADTKMNSFKEKYVKNVLMYEEPDKMNLIGGLAASQQEPFVYIAYNRKTGDWKTSQLQMNKVFEFANTMHKEYDKLIIPIYPTVYSPAEPGHSSADLDYYRSLKTFLNDSKGESVLVVGPGSGSDSWVVSMFTENKVYCIGINPLEIANTKNTARLGSFDVETYLGNNIVGENGKPLIQGRKFDKIIWNMPFIMKLKSHVEKQFMGYTSLWDGDYNAVVLKRFLAALPLVLKENGETLIWNSDIPEEIIREFSATLKITKKAKLTYSIKNLVKEIEKPTEYLTAHNTFIKVDGVKKINGLILPENISLVMGWKLEGLNDWEISGRIARLEFIGSINPVKYFKFFREHFKYYGDGRALGIAAMWVVTTFTYFTGRLNHLSVESAGKAARKAQIAFHAKWDLPAIQNIKVGVIYVGKRQHEAGSSKLTENITQKDCQDAKEAAEMIKKNCGTDNLKCRKTNEEDSFGQSIVVDYSGDIKTVKRTLSDAGINSAVVVPSDEWEKIPKENMKAELLRMQSVNHANSFMYGQRIGLKVDEELIKSLEVHNLSVNSDMYVERKDYRKIESKISDLKRCGVLVYVIENDGSVTIGDKPVEVNGKAMKVVRFELGAKQVYNENTILDIEIPENMNEATIKDKLEELNLSQRMMFRSSEVRRDINKFRDITDKKAFASFFNIVINLGKKEISTSAEAREQGFNWEVPLIEDEQIMEEVITALKNNKLETLKGLMPLDSAKALILHRNMMNPEFRNSFIEGMVVKLLIKAELLKKDKQFALEYSNNKCKINTIDEEKLGNLLLKKLGQPGGTLAMEENEALDFLINSVVSDWRITKVIRKEGMGLIDLKNFKSVLGAA